MSKLLQKGAFLVLMYKLRTFLIVALLYSNGICYASTPGDVVIVTTVNDLSSRILKENSIYKITGDIDLNNTTIELPSNAILLFRGGRLLNGALKGNGSCIEAYITHILENVRLSGIWKNECLYPEWFGAVGDGVHDDTKAIRLTILNAFNNHKEIRLASPYYYVAGDNPFGLEYFNEENEIPFFYKEGLKGDDNRSRYNLNIDGNGALVFWEPLREDDVFSFVGYLRNSLIQNFTIVCKQKKNNLYGDIFSTHFSKEGQCHIFSNNIFRNIRISGGCRRVFSFDSFNEKQSHDDLSLFEKITASDYKVFCYISNGNAVGNAFYNCNTCLSVDGAVDYYINCNSWAGNLRIVGQHFTIMNCTDAVIIKDDSGIIRDRIIYVDMPRLEVLNTAKRWKYFDISGITLYINGIESITNPGYEDGMVYGIVRTEYAQVNISDVKGLYQPFALYSIQRNPFRPAIVFNNCSFRKDSDIRNIQEYPIIYYYGKDSLYKDTPSALLSKELFPYYKVTNSTSGDNLNQKMYSSWNIDYEMGRLVAAPVKTALLTSTQIKNDVRMSLVGDNISYIVPCDMIITQLIYNCIGNSDLGAVVLSVDNKKKKSYTLVPVKETNKIAFKSPKPFSVNAGTLLSFSFENNRGNTKNEAELGVEESFFEVYYRLPFLVSDYRSLINQE